ncbi:glycosyltransferase, partial [Burkholderia sp. SIMBA_024]
SGAFSAFRRKALDDIRGFDVGGGEDLDTTIRLRLKGWRIEYAPEAVCYTDVPTTVYQYIRQRLRWERDAIWIRYRKHVQLM